VGAPTFSLVDRLARPDGQRDAARFARAVVRPESEFSRSFSAGARDHAAILDRPAIYAVEAAVRSGEAGVSLTLRETVLWTNRSQQTVDRIVLRVMGNGQERFTDNAAIRDVLVNGVRARAAIHHTILVVTPAVPLAPGELARLHLELEEGVPPFEVTSHWENSVNPEVDGAFGVHGGMVNLGGWLPLVVPLSLAGVWDEAAIPRNGESGWNDPALFDVWLEVPVAWEVATTGVELSRVDDGARRRIHAVASSARDFAIEAGTGQMISEADLSGIHVRVMHSAAHPAIGKDFLRTAESALALFVDRFGPLPLAELDIVDAPVNVALGNEFPGLVTLDTHQELYGGYLPSRYHEWTLAHEISHQWWSVEVGSDPRSEPWVDEALAAWSASLYWRREHGSQALEARHREDVYQPYAEMKGLGIPDLPANLPSDAYDLTQYAAIVYGRAPLWFDQLVDAIGDEEVYAGLQAYYASNHCRLATGDDLVAALEASTDHPERVRALYDRWIAGAHGFEDLAGK
jgi:hypothetical protein